MFSGIIEETGRLESLEPGKAAWRMRVSAERAAEGTAQGDSVAVNGCCLTVVGREPGRLVFDVLEETLRLTHFPELKPGARINLERSLAVGDRIGGHFLSGHVDGMGEIQVLEKRGQDHYLRVVGPAGSGRHLVHKGSIAVDGISLTVAETVADSFAVWLIPHTLAATDLSEKRPGDLVNLEFDLLGKYVEKLLAARFGPLEQVRPA